MRIKKNDNKVINFQFKIPFCLILFTVLFFTSAMSAERIALVIGNAAYEHTLPLDNSVHDAVDIAATLESMDFVVILETDIDKGKIVDAMREFESLLQASGEDTVGLFFYSGHAGEINGINYLYPVDIEFKKKNEGTYDGVPVQMLLSKMQEAKNKMNIIILDACRDNPYGEKSRSVSQSTNKLADMQVPVGSIVAYSTASGKLAADGDGDGGNNGLYTQELLRFIQQPGLKIEDIFKRVRKSVREKSDNRQVAWEQSSLEGDFYFIPPIEQTELVQESISENSVDSSVSIHSNIQGAQIFINGKQVGKSPLTLDDLDEGTILVQLQKNGFLPVEKKVLIRKSRGIDLNFLMKQIPMAHLSVKSFPAQAEWYLDGVLIGETPDKIDRIKPGKHQVKLLKSGYQPWQKEVNLSVGSIKKMNVTLEALESTTKNQHVAKTESIKISKATTINQGIEIQDKDFAPEMVVISRGQYMMGDASGIGKEDELPVHNVNINQQFAIGKYEVTFEQYDYFSKESGRKKADDFGFGRGKYPVISVSWEDAIAYTKWLTEQTGHKYRLPSEAEWEYVARAGKNTPRYWTEKTAELELDVLACQNANIADLSLKAKKPYQQAHQCDDHYPNTAPVGSFKPNTFGLYDLLGNVAEWTGSFYTTPYKGQELRNDEGDVWGKRSIRGGSWSSKPSDVTVAARSFQAGAATALNLGFRVVRELDDNNKISLK